MIAAICAAAVLLRNRTNTIHKPNGVMAFGILLIGSSVPTICAYGAVSGPFAISRAISVYAMAIAMVLPVLALVSGIFIMQLNERARKLLIVLAILGLVGSILPFVLFALGHTRGPLFNLRLQLFYPKTAPLSVLIQVLCFAWFTTYFHDIIGACLLFIYTIMIIPMKLTFYVSALVYFNKRRIKSLFNWRSNAAGRAVGPTAPNSPCPARADERPSA